MSTAPTTAHDRAGPLRHRVSATEAMIQQIDGKLARLNAARLDRANALNRIRRELARALAAEPATAASHERANR
jgi:hypothetical protein